MSNLKYHPSVVVALILLLGMLVGAVAGLGLGLYETYSIAAKVKASDPSDPLDMLHFVALGYIFIGCCAGTLLGALVASIVYLNQRADEIDRRASSAT